MIYFSTFGSWKFKLAENRFHWIFLSNLRIIYLRFVLGKVFGLKANKLFKFVVDRQHLMIKIVNHYAVLDITGEQTLPNVFELTGFRDAVDVKQRLMIR